MSSEDNRITIIVDNITRYTKLRKNLTIACFTVVGLSFLFFILYGFFSSNQAIQFVADHKIKGEKLEKVMTKPRIKFEYKENEFYDIEADTAVHKDGEDVLLTDVVASGISGNITAGELLIKESGDRLFFSENPVLTIKQVKQPQTQGNL